jgi:hypothetical protein
MTKKPTPRKPAPPKKAQTAIVAVESLRAPPARPVSATRIDARNLSGYFPTPDVIAFRALAASQEKDVQELLAEGLNVIFERYGLPNRIPIVSGRRTRRGR